MKPLIAVYGRGSSRLPLKVDDGCSVREPFHNQPGLCFTALHIVCSHMGIDIRDSSHITVDGNHRDTGINRLLESRGHRVHVNRTDDDTIHTLDDG